MNVFRHLWFWALRQARPGALAHRLLPLSARNKIVLARERITKENFQVVGAPPAADMRGKIIAYVFAGRRDRMSILLGYLDELLAQKQIDALHVWNLARNDADREWVRGLANNKGYSVMEFAVGDGFKIHKSKQSALGVAAVMWREAHNFYAQSCYDGCGLVKIDDDIVFADTPRFGVFRDALLRLACGENGGCHLISANVVNNYICDYLRRQEGIIPPDVAEFDSPPAHKMTLKQEADYYRRGKTSQAVHEFFLQNPWRFLREDGKDIQIKPNSRFTINFIGLTNAVLPIPDSALDEAFLSWDLPPEKRKGITVIRGFTAAHLSFGVQSEQNDSELIAKYRELQKRAPFLPDADE